MESFRDKVNSGRTFEERTARVMDNIDLEGSESNQWMPIDNFRGTFEGNKKTIKNLYINNSDTTENVGLFSVVTNAEIRNVSIVSGEINSPKSNVVGCIAGQTINTIIYNCKNYVNITSGGYAGGIVGREVETNITKCSNRGEITGRVVGGICGFLVGEKVGIIECYNTGSIRVIDGIDTMSHCGGGIIGKAMDAVIQFEDSYNSGSITSTIGKIEGFAGGIIGFLQYKNYKAQFDMINCYNIGNNTGNSQIKGGIIGFLSNENSSTINLANNYWVTRYGSSYGIGEPKSNTGTISKDTNGIKTIVNQLGDKYTIDVQNTDGTWKYNNGYPILKWQIESK